MAIVEAKTNLWEVLAGRSPGQPLAPADVDLWKAVSERLNPAKATPLLREGIEKAHLTSVRGEDYVMLRSPDPDSAGYLRLSPEEISLAHLMDGTRTVATLVGEFVTITGTLAPDRVLRLVADLAGNKMLEELPVDAFHPLQRFRSHRGPLPDRLARGLLATIKGQRMVLANPDRLVDWLYRAGGKFLFSRVAAFVLGLVALAGIVLFARTWLAGAESIFLVGDSYLQGALLLLGLNVVALASHELGHGLTAKHAGRRVPAIGFLLYFGLPSVFVDTTDVWMAGRRARILTSAAGPIAALTFAGAIQLAGFVWPALGLIAFKIAFVWYLNSLFNLNPLMALDGYYLFMDWLELPNLRPKAMAMIAGWARHRRPRWNDLDKEGRLVGIYALLALGWVVVMINLSIRLWRDRVTGLITGLWNSGTWARVLLLVVVAALAAPLVFAFVGLISRVSRRISARIRERKRERDLPRRVDALRASVLGFLTETQMVEIAREATWLHPRSGTPILGGPGPAPTQAVVVVDGAVEARSAEDPPGTVRHRARPGDLFSAPEGSPPLTWVTAGTSLLTVPIQALGKKITAYLTTLTSEEQEKERRRLLAPLVSAPVVSPTTSILATAGVHPVAGYPPLIPRPDAPGPGNDKRDDRFRRTLLLLLLLVVLLALMTAPMALGRSTPWAEMPPQHVLLEVTRGEVAVNPASEFLVLTKGDTRYLKPGDQVEVEENSNALLTFDGGGTATLCSQSETGIEAVTTGDTSPLEPYGELTLERGTLIADTSSISEAYGPLALTLMTGDHIVVNDGESSYAVSAWSAPVQVLHGVVTIDGTSQPIADDPVICPSGEGDPVPAPETTTTEPPETTTTEQATTTFGDTTITTKETTTTAPEATTTAPSTSTPPTATATTQPPTTTAPTTTPSTDPTTTAPTPPLVIHGVRLTVPRIYEVGRCLPVVTDVLVDVSNASSVSITWLVNSTSGSAAMQHSGGDIWRADFGSFPPGTLTSTQTEATINVTATAINSGGSATGSITGRLLRCRG